MGRHAWSLKVEALIKGRCDLGYQKNKRKEHENTVFSRFLVLMPEVSQKRHLECQKNETRFLAPMLRVSKRVRRNIFLIIVSPIPGGIMRDIFRIEKSIFFNLPNSV